MAHLMLDLPYNHLQLLFLKLQGGQVALELLELILLLFLFILRQFDGSHVLLLTKPILASA
jgi:hypothetical protein